MKHLKEYKKWNGSYEVDDIVWVSAAGQKFIGKVIEVHEELHSSYWYKIEYLKDFDDGFNTQSVTGDKLDLLTPEEIEKYELEKETGKYNI